jgi:tetratricopeptide (TPR) repeat protein
MKDFYRFWQVHAPHYTDHGETHCKTLEKNLDELIPDELKNEINEYEIFVLLSSVYLHDVGIMCATTSEEENKEIRKNHHERSEQFITNNLKDLLNGPERYVIGKMAFAHRDFVPIDDIVLVRTIRHTTLGNQQIRVQFLAGLLRLADSCDLCHTRTTEDLVTVGKLSEEANFHHALHERVSGISFDTKEKTIFVDLNIASDEEQTICQEYIITPLQRSLNSAKDILIKNGVVYIGVTPRYTKAATLSTKLSVPKRTEKPVLRPAKAHSRLVEAYKLIKQANTFSNAKEYDKGVKCIEEAIRIIPTDPLSWLIRGQIYAKLGKLDEACKSYDKVAEFGSKDSFNNQEVGHFYGEIMLDYEKSAKFYEKAYQQNPNDTLTVLNYAETLITVGKPQEAYNLATRIWNETIDIIRRFHSWTIRVLSLFFLENQQKGLDELKNFFYFIKGCFSLIKKKNIWVYNKIRKYTNESSLSKESKNLLLALIDLAEGKISVDDFEQVLNKFTSK